MAGKVWFCSLAQLAFFSSVARSRNRPDLALRLLLFGGSSLFCFTPKVNSTCSFFWVIPKGPPGISSSNLFGPSLPAFPSRPAFSAPRLKVAIELPAGVQDLEATSRRIALAIARSVCSTRINFGGEGESRRRQHETSKPVCVSRGSKGDPHLRRR